MKSRHSKSAAYTLVEVLVVLVITSLLTLALFSSFRAGVQSWKTGENYIERTEGGRQLINLLRRHLLQAEPEQVLDRGSLLFSFQGDTDWIQYVAPLSMSASGEHYLIELVSNLPGKPGLWGRFGRYSPGLSADEILADSEYLLLIKDAELEFAYYEFGNQEGAWLEQWRGRLTFPALVKAKISEPGKIWPAIVLRVGKG